jgi:hypothetical protein
MAQGRRAASAQQQPAHRHTGTPAHRRKRKALGGNTLRGLFIVRTRYLFTSFAGTLSASNPPSTMNAASIYMPESLAAVACLSQPTA